MKRVWCIIVLLTNLLVVNTYAQTIDSTNIDSLLQAKFDAHYLKTFTLEDSVFEVGSVLVEDVVFYDGRLHQKGIRQLSLIFEFLKQNESLHVLIVNHTGVRGKEAYNNAVSKRRAEGVMYYLASKGISESRLKYSGKGESDLIISQEETLTLPTKLLQEKAHALNRRTEFKIISID